MKKLSIGENMDDELIKNLIDGLEMLERTKKDTETKIENLKSEIINIITLEGKPYLDGTYKRCFVKGYQKVIYPQDKDSFVKLIKEKGIYEYFSQINYSRLRSAIIKNDLQIDKEILERVKVVKDFRVSLINIGGMHDRIDTPFD